MNKIISKEIFIKNKILFQNILQLEKQLNTKKYFKKNIKKKKIKFPIVIKPINEGSSLELKFLKI